jgi:hypothetical protein
MTNGNVQNTGWPYFLEKLNCVRSHGHDNVELLIAILA